MLGNFNGNQERNDFYLLPVKGKVSQFTHTQLKIIPGNLSLQCTYWSQFVLPNENKGLGEVSSLLIVPTKVAISKAYYKSEYRLYTTSHKLFRLLITQLKEIFRLVYDLL